jgi:multiple sugar transport system permease protein
MRGRRPLTNLANILKYLLLTFGAAVMLSPLLFALYMSLEAPSDYMTLVGPDRLTLQNYEYVVTNAPILRWYANTIFVTVCMVLGAVGVNTAAGYALARIDFPGRRPLFLLILAILMVPLQAYLIPLYLMVAQLGWLNSYQALIVPFVVNPFLVFLMRQSFQALPKDLEDAAAVDGAGRFTTFIRIAVPLTMTGIVTQAILAGTWTWNSFVIPVTMTTDKDLFVLTVGLNSLQSRFYTLPTIQMAGAVLLTIPVVVMFVAFQRYIVPTLASTGIRG